MFLGVCLFYSTVGCKNKYFSNRHAKFVCSVHMNVKLCIFSNIYCIRVSYYANKKTFLVIFLKVAFF